MTTAPMPPLAPAIRRQTIADALHRTALRLPAKTAIVCGDTACAPRMVGEARWTRSGPTARRVRAVPGHGQPTGWVPCPGSGAE